MFVEAALLFLLLLLLYWLYMNRLPPNYPATPPFRVPYYEHKLHLLLSGGNPHEAFGALYKRYSKDGMLALHLGKERRIVLIGDYKVMKEVLRREEANHRLTDRHKFQNRRRDRRMPEYADGDEGLLNSQGKKWQEQRKFTQSTLREFGFGKTSMNDLINEEIDHFITYLTKKAKENNGIVTMQNFFNIAVLNILWTIIQGERYAYNDPQLMDLIENAFNICSSPRPPTILMKLSIFHPIFKSLGMFSRYNDKDHAANLRNFIERNVKKHREDFDPLNIRDFIDSYLLAIEQTQDPNSSFYGQQGHEQLINVLGDLFLAGSETTSSTLSWGSLFLLRNPDVQGRMRAEIEEVIGRDQSPSYSDQERMPYTEATIMEIQRMGDIAPNSVPHATQDKELRLGAYTIPKQHKIIPLLTAIHKTEEYWDRPLEFRPERHLDTDGQIIKRDSLIPFGTGKRKCPGESIARAELFLFFTRLIQAFNLEPVDPNNLPPTEAHTRITSVPKPYELRLVHLF